MFSQTTICWVVKYIKTQFVGGDKTFLNRVLKLVLILGKLTNTKQFFGTKT